MKSWPSGNKKFRHASSMTRNTPDWLKNFRPSVQKATAHEQILQEDRIPLSLDEIVQIIAYCFSETGYDINRLRNKLDKSRRTQGLADFEASLRTVLSSFPEQDIAFLQRYLNEPEFFSPHTTPPKIITVKNRIKKSLEAQLTKNTHL